MRHARHVVVARLRIGLGERVWLCQSFKRGTKLVRCTRDGDSDIATEVLPGDGILHIMLLNVNCEALLGVVLISKPLCHSIIYIEARNVAFCCRSYWTMKTLTHRSIQGHFTHTEQKLQSTDDSGTGSRS